MITSIKYVSRLLIVSTLSMTLENATTKQPRSQKKGQLYLLKKRLSIKANVPEEIARGLQFSLGCTIAIPRMLENLVRIKTLAHVLNLKLMLFK